MKKRVPKLKSDSAAAEFLEQDLSGLDFAQFQPVQFEFEKKRRASTCACHSPSWMP